MKKQVTLYHVWGKTLFGRKMQMDTYRPVRIGEKINIAGKKYKVVDYAKYQLNC